MAIAWCGDKLRLPANSRGRLCRLMLILILPIAVNTAASGAHQYCEEMYPADSYEGEQRNSYIQECLAAYGEDSGTNVEAAPQEPAMDAYEGTVDEFVNTVAPEPQEVPTQ